MVLTLLDKVSNLIWRPPWPWRIGLGVPLLAGVVLAVGAGISWLGADYEPPEEIEAGHVDDFAIGSRTYFKEERVWLVRLPDAELALGAAEGFDALYDRDPESSCAVSFRFEYEFMGRTGWFRDACHGSVYDLAGRCFEGPCERGLDRFAVEVSGGNVVVRLRELIRGPPRDEQVEPVNPPQQ